MDRCLGQCLSKCSALLFAAVVAWSQMEYVAAFANPTSVSIGSQNVFNPGSAKTGTVQQNLDNALVACRTPGPASVSVVSVKGVPVITLGGFYVCEIDTATARAHNTTANALAQSWANGLRLALKNRTTVNAYMARLTGHPAVNPGTTSSEAGSYRYYKRGNIIYMPTGMSFPVALTTQLSSQYAHPGDIVEGKITEDIMFGDTSIPQNSTVVGQVTSASPGSKMAHAGELALKFNRLRTPSGVETPIVAHIVGGLSKEGPPSKDGELFKGSTLSSRVKRVALDGAIGAGTGALAGTAIGAIASHGYGTGRGALAGMTIGGALGVAGSLLLRKGANVHVDPGSILKLQLDAPAKIAG
jgi:hypothetical protein